MPISINTDEDLEALEKGVRRAADSALRQLKGLTAVAHDGLAFMRELKFGNLGMHPVEKRELHLIEQINQTMTYMVAIAALRKLRELHRNKSYNLLRATESGPDIESRDREVVAEVFAAVHPNNNRKLQRDVERAANSGAVYRFVFFSAPG